MMATGLYSLGVITLFLNESSYCLALEARMFVLMTWRVRYRKYDSALMTLPMIYSGQAETGTCGQNLTRKLVCK